MKKIIALLMAMLCVCSMTVFANGETTVTGTTGETNDTTNFTYVVTETYTWSAPADIIFTPQSNNLDKQEGTVKVTDNVIPGDKRLSITIKDQDFKVVTDKGAERTYKIYKGTKSSLGTELNKTDEVLTVATGVSTGSQNIVFELQNAADAIQAGTYNGTLGFIANLVAA